MVGRAWDNPIGLAAYCMHGHTEKGFAIPAHAAIKHVPCFSPFWAGPAFPFGKPAGVPASEPTMKRTGPAMNPSV